MICTCHIDTLSSSSSSSSSERKKKNNKIVPLKKNSSLLLACTHRVYVMYTSYRHKVCDMYTCLYTQICTHISMHISLYTISIHSTHISTKSVICTHISIHRYVHISLWYLHISINILRTCQLGRYICVYI